MLAIAALVWGTSFVAQRVGMDDIGPITFTCVRSFIGAVALLPVALLFEKRPENKAKDKKDLWKGGLICGCLLSVATTLQQIGVKYTTAGKAGFITALYIVLVPIVGFLLFKKRPSFNVWIAVGIALVGMYLLCITDGFSLATGDMWVLGCSFVFTFHILFIDIYAPKCNGVMLSCMQFAVAGVITCVAMFIFEKPDIDAILSCALPLIYVGVMSSGLAYTLQILGQERVEPTVSVLISSFESVFAAISGWIILNEGLSVKELMGCVLMFIAVILSQLNLSKKKL